MKTVALLTLSGALLGVVAASYVVPPALTWYSEPGGLPGHATVQALVNIPDVIKYATSKLLRGQVIGGSIGGVVGLALGVFIAIRGRRKPVAV